MNEWWNNLTILQHLFYYCAIPATLILIIQTLLTILGLGNDMDGDIDFDSDIDLDGDMDIQGNYDVAEMDSDVLESSASLKFFSIRGIIAFFTLFGWVGVVLSDTNLNNILIFIFAILSGLAGMFIIALMFYGFTRMQSSGNINLKNALGTTGEIYIPIPPNRSGKGKIQLTLQERFIEANAMTDDNKILSTGSRVRVVDVIDINTLLVEKN